MLRIGEIIIFTLHFCFVLKFQENQLPTDVCSTSRSYEEDLFTHMPPTSPYLVENFPRLYDQNSSDYGYLKIWETLRSKALANSAVTRDIAQNGLSKPYQYLQQSSNTQKGAFIDAQYVDKVFTNNYEKLKTGNVNIVEVSEIENKIAKEDKTKLKDMNVQSGFLNEISGTTKHDIVEVSQMIRNHCKNHLIPLNKFLNEFKVFGERSELKNTVHNVSFYIKRKMVHAELKMIADQKNNLKTFEDEFDLISFEEKATKQLEVNSNADYEKKENANDSSTEKKVPDTSIETIDNVNKIMEQKTLTPLRSIVKTDGVNGDVKPGDPGSVTILSRDNKNPKSNSGFSNSFVTLETMKGRLI